MSRTMRANRSSHWQCHWSRLTDWLAHWRGRLWARHCSRLTSCTWTYDQIHWWVERWERVDHRIEDRCHWSRLTSCTWTDRRTDSLVGRAMRRSSHWRCYWSRLTESLLLKIKTSRSSRLVSLIALWGRDFTQFYDWSRLFIKFEEFLANLNERLIRWSSDLVEWFRSFVYTHWPAHEFESFVYSRWVSSWERRVSVCTIASRLDQSQ